MSLTIFGTFPKDPADEISARIPSLGNVTQEEISRFIKSSPLLLYSYRTILFRKYAKSFYPLWLREYDLGLT